MALTIGSLVAYLDVNDAAFKAKLAAADAEFKTSADKMTAQGVRQAAAFGKLVNAAKWGAVAGAAAIGLSLHTYEDFVIQVEKLSKQTGMSAEGTSKFVGQLQMLHVNSATAGMAIKTMEKAMYGLQTGDAAATAAFKILGLSWSDLANLKPEDQIALIRDRLSEVKDPAARAAAAQTLLGRGAKDMVLWYTASDSAIGKVNKTLKDNGQILNDQQVKDAGKAAASWQVFSGALKGLQYAIAQSALPWLTRLLNVVTGIVRALRPFAPLLAPITIALAIFVGVVKTAVFFQKTWNQLLALFPAKVVEAKVAEEGLTAATAGETAAQTVGLGVMGLYAAALLGIVADIYLLVKAYDAWRSAEDAINQEMQQAQGESAVAKSAQAKIDAWKAAHPGQALPADLQVLQNDVNTALTEAQGNVGGQVLKNLPSNIILGKGYKALMGLAAGGDFITNGPTPILTGEVARERVTVTPLDGRHGSGGGVHFHNCSFSAHTPRELAAQVSREVMRGVQRQMVGQNA